MHDGSQESVRKASYRIEGLDCAEEVAILRSALGAKPGVVDMDFDVLNARMSVEYDPVQVSSDDIVSAVGATGMEAIPWDQRTKQETVSLWAQYGRLVTASASGALLVAGLTASTIVTLWVLPALYRWFVTLDAAIRQAR